ncbi:NADH:ubiquinone reductase (Na(+)-transporting) subunit C [uncultured Sulfitobacter sp.]|uniref:NADH:ubiquinone reductase (Na(+)-transporting) subunit C n=1 Tax=uncultured Sulfitobacter sp. TaxID=191468 RepID=UPI0026388646|nr:NADH:ubiquinone reductase (Na(+)-transporting) subunit C [uncultured Sulfitobacter sp.]
MSDRLSLWQHFLARPNDDRSKIFGVAVLVALVCAIIVSLTSISLKPLQDANFAALRAARMAAMLDTLPGMRDVMEEAGIDTLDSRLVDLTTGTFVEDADVAAFDPRAAKSDPAQSVAILPEKDIAGLRRRANLAPVFLLERQGEVLLLVLPVSGAGYQSTLHAMLALDPDLRTIAALTITEQGETPGLGARIEDPSWQALWAGKEAVDEAGNIVVTVVRGQATTPFEIDGITGATITSNGVANMVRFWLGDDGFGPFLKRLRQEGL